MAHSSSCENCAVAKAQQENVYKESNGKRATEPNERWYHGIVTIKSTRKGGIKVNKPVWHIMVDEATGMKMSEFYTRKDKMVEPMCERLQI